MPPIETLKNRRDFTGLRKAPSFGAPGFLLVKRARGDAGPPRIGYTVTKKLGSAVLRNRIRRRLKAAAAEVFPVSAEAGVDYVFIARSAAATRSFASLLDDVKRGLLRLSKRPK
ncbi:MAG: ribonuclease P protein component [Pseudomonadota bacterium]